MIVQFLAAGLLAAGMAAAEGPSWQPAGATDAVSLHDGGTITLDATDGQTAGALSSPFKLPGGCDAVLVEAEVSGAAAGAVVIAVHDAASGQPLGYWQNPVALEEPTREAAVMKLTQPAERIRLFVGTDGRASSAEVSVLKITPLRVAATYPSMQYAAAVDAERTAGQTFTARGSRFGGLTLRTRFAQSIDGPHPDLLARLYAWQGDLSATRASAVLAESAIPGRLIPAGSRSIERDLMLPFDTEVTPGQTYYVEVSQAAAGGAGGGADAPACLLFAGPDGIDGGQMYQDDRPQPWDLNTTIYQGK